MEPRHWRRDMALGTHRMSWQMFVLWLRPATGISHWRVFIQPCPTRVNNLNSNSKRRNVWPCVVHRRWETFRWAEQVGLWRQNTWCFDQPLHGMTPPLESEINLVWVHVCLVGQCIIDLHFNWGENYFLSCIYIYIIFIYNILLVSWAELHYTYLYPFT